MYTIKGNPLENIKSDGGFTAIFRTIGCIGDSLSSGEHESKLNGVTGYHDYYEYSWGQFIARQCGLTAYNFSTGGLKAKDFHDLARYHKVFTPEKACQAYIIALGVNDISAVVNGLMEFGNLDDVDFNNYENNKDTVIGNYVKIIQRIRELESKARIFVVTMPKDPDRVEPRVTYYKEFCEFLRKLPEIFDYLYVIDLEKYAPVYDADFKKRYFLGGHLNAMGYKFTADMFTTYIDHIIQNNPEDFAQVGFIGKGYYHEDAKF